VNGLSVCSGIGGLDLGLEWAGINITGQVEIDPWCRGVLARHWPDVPQHDDIRTAAQWWLSERRPQADVIFGGIPCQPHSVAGKRLGTADSRWIWPAVRDLIDAVAPQYVIIENVPRFIRSGLIDVLRDLAALGFDAEWGCIPAAALGAPHLRWRIFLFAALADPGRDPGYQRRPDHARQSPGGRHAHRSAVGADGAQWALADPEHAGRGEDDPARSALVRENIGVQAGRHETSGGIELRSADVAGLQRGRQPEPGLGGGPDGFPGWLDGSWEARVPRTVPRQPDHNDRIRGLGNAVVPAVAEYAGRLFMQWAQRRSLDQHRNRGR
jgi:DNA (cytosine-5)-methyltransferase 1